MNTKTKNEAKNKGRRLTMFVKNAHSNIKYEFVIAPQP